MHTADDEVYSLHDKWPSSIMILRFICDILADFFESSEKLTFERNSISEKKHTQTNDRY